MDVSWDVFVNWVFAIVHVFGDARFNGTVTCGHDKYAYIEGRFSGKVRLPDGRTLPLEEVFGVGDKTVIRVRVPVKPNARDFKWNISVYETAVLLSRDCKGKPCWDWFIRYSSFDRRISMVDPVLDAKTVFGTLIDAMSKEALKCAKPIKVKN